MAYVQTLPKTEAEKRINKAHFAAGLEGYPLHFSMDRNDIQSRTPDPNQSRRPCLILWLENPTCVARILRGIFYQPAHTFAKSMLEFDKAVDECGLVDASRLALGHYVRDVRVFGLDRVPDSAFLALSNHPGMTDTLALFAALNRPDLKVIALDRPFLMALPNMSRQLFFVKDDPTSRMKLVREVSGHLRNGGAALTFPAGKSNQTQTFTLAQWMPCKRGQIAWASLSAWRLRL